jgi:hypothetical protein
MERSSCNGGRSVAKEAGVWFEVRHRLTSVDVKDLDPMFLCSTVKSQLTSQITYSCVSDTYVAKTGACS